MVLVAPHVYLGLDMSVMRGSVYVGQMVLCQDLYCLICLKLKEKWKKVSKAKQFLRLNPLCIISNKYDRH